MAIKARDIEDNLKNDFDPRLIHTLMALAEAQAVLREQILTAAETLNRVQDHLNEHQLVQGKMADVLDKIKKKDPEIFEDPVTSILEH